MSALTSPRIPAPKAPRISGRPRLQIAVPAPSSSARAPFILVIIALVSLGLVGLIVMSTILQRQSFTLADLDRQATDLTNQKQAMAHDLARLQSPESVAQQAVALGMVPNTNPVFLEMRNGKIVGQPKVAVAGTNVKRVSQ
ncbi:hypothetical protein BH09ACT10_BH09ACT10_02930 [soil metagenome]